MSSIVMELGERLYEGIFLRRLNRFMAEVELDGRRVLAHLPNSSRMLTVLLSHAKAFVVKRERPGRKSGYTMFAIERRHVPIIVNTRFANKVTKAMIDRSLFPPLRKYRVLRQNVRVDDPLIDFLLGRNGQRLYLEVKSVSYVVNGVAMFPDAPTIRGQRHIKVLMHCVKQGFHAGILFTVQRPDATVVRPCYEIDP
ncbi:MAG: DNA/RNA nuclease SfsA, partial [Candidatus Freyarchaeota archaeon]